MLKVKFGTAESKLKKHIGTDHSFCAQRRSDRAEKRNLLSAVPQFTFSSHAIYFQHFSYYQHRSTPTGEPFIAVSFHATCICSETGFTIFCSHFQLGPLENAPGSADAGAELQIWKWW